MSITGKMPVPQRVNFIVGRMVGYSDKSQISLLTIYSIFPISISFSTNIFTECSCVRIPVSRNPTTTYPRSPDLANLAADRDRMLKFGFVWLKQSFIILIPIVEFSSSTQPITTTYFVALLGTPNVQG
jgi:hypothetical protein